MRYPKTAGAKEEKRTWEPVVRWATFSPLPALGCILAPDGKSKLEIKRTLHRKVHLYHSPFPRHFRPVFPTEAGKGNRPTDLSSAHPVTTDNNEHYSWCFKKCSVAMATPPFLRVISAVWDLMGRADLGSDGEGCPDRMQMSGRVTEESESPSSAPWRGNTTPLSLSLSLGEGHGSTEAI